MNNIFNMKYEKMLEESRIEAMQHIESTCNGLEPEHMFSHIWFASTNILPKLEVQVVIDANDKLHISTGSSGYVDFRTNPIGIKLPIKCWIHTHPFGMAYFSSTDWSTVNTWQPLMLEAYVLGGENHYGHWNNNNPHKLIIIEKDGNIRVQDQRIDKYGNYKYWVKEARTRQSFILEGEE